MRLTNTPGNPRNPMELLFPPCNPGNVQEIYNVSCKCSGLVREFVHLSLILVTFLVLQSVSVRNNSQ